MWRTSFVWHVHNLGRRGGKHAMLSPVHARMQSLNGCKLEAVLYKGDVEDLKLPITKKEALRASRD